MTLWNPFPQPPSLPTPAFLSIHVSIKCAQQQQRQFKMYQVAIVTNKNNTREVEGVTHHLNIFSWGEKNALISTWCEGLSVSGLRMGCKLFQFMSCIPYCLVY